MLPTTHTNNITIPKGRVFLKSATDYAYRYLGSNQVANLTRDVEGLDLRSAEDGIGKRLEHHTINVDYTLGLTISDISLPNLALFVNGVPYTVTQTSGSTSETVVAAVGGLYRLGTGTNATGSRSVTGITVSHAVGSTAVVWEDLNIYALNEVAVPTVSNGFFYTVTIAGTSAGTEPTWPTTVGATVSDGSVTWTNTGAVDLVLGTDYEVDGDLGQVFIKSTSPNVIVGDDYIIGYTNSGVTWLEIKDGTSQLYYEVLINSTNPVGKKIDYLFPRCTFEASGDFTLKSDETAYQLLEVAVHILQPDDGRSSVYVSGRPL